MDRYRGQCIEKHGTGWRPRLCAGGETRNGRVCQQKKDAVRQLRLFQRDPTRYEHPGRERAIHNVERHGSGWRARVTINKKRYKGTLRQTVAEALVDVIRLRRAARSSMAADEATENDNAQSQDTVHAYSTMR